MMISLCFPTRERPEIFKTMCLSALNMAFNPNNIEFVTYHDNDDTSVYEYIGNHKEVAGPRVGYPAQMINECQKIASGPLYMYLADDIIFETKDWDIKVEETFNKYPDKIVLVMPDSSDWEVWKFGTAGFIHKNWVDAVGYFCCPDDGAQGADRWLNDIAVAVGRRVRLLDMRIRHTNYRDHVHASKNRHGRHEQWTKKYWLPEVAEVRERDIRALQEYIKKSTL